MVLFVDVRAQHGNDLPHDGGRRRDAAHAHCDRKLGRQRVAFAVLRLHDRDRTVGQMRMVRQNRKQRPFLELQVLLQVGFQERKKLLHAGGIRRRYGFDPVESTILDFPEISPIAVD